MCELSGKQDDQDFLVLIKALHMIGLSYEQLTSIWAMLAGILQLGNICFTSCEVCCTLGNFKVTLVMHSRMTERNLTHHLPELHPSLIMAARWRRRRASSSTLYLRVKLQVTSSDVRCLGDPLGKSLLGPQWPIRCNHYHCHYW